MVAHLAARKTYGLMKKQFFWRGMKVDVENFVRQCESCQLNKKSQNKKAGKLQLFPATFPFEVLGMDILGPFTVTDSGNKYVLVVVDRFTRWVEIFAMPDIYDGSNSSRYLHESNYLSIFGPEGTSD